MPAFPGVLYRDRHSVSETLQKPHYVQVKRDFQQLSDIIPGENKATVLNAWWAMPLLWHETVKHFNRMQFQGELPQFSTPPSLFHRSV